MVIPPRHLRLPAPTAWLFLTPALLLLVVFRLIPALSAVAHAFTDWDGVTAPTAAGLANFGQLAHDPVFRTAVGNNLLLVAAVPVWLLVSLVLALLIHQEVPGWRFFRASFFLPSVLSPVIVGTLFTALLRSDGPVNRGVQLLGARGFRVDWLGNPNTALPTLTLVILWGIFGLGVIVFLAGLAAVPSEILEAGRLDGATGWTYLRHIVVPPLRHVIEFWAVNLVVWSFTSLFAFVYVMTGGGPGYRTMLVEYQLYLQAFELNRMGYACALGTALFCMVFGVVLLQVRLMTGEEE
ncbi:MAG: sugar ABC transporter permease [Armatimonadetes bacterium]|nr:sugar ABC transporter permease [Armatimonadota bacterium]